MLSSREARKRSKSNCFFLGFSRPLNTVNKEGHGVTIRLVREGGAQSAAFTSFGPTRKL
jgi:hypothetical protein